MIINGKSFNHARANTSLLTILFNNVKQRMTGLPLNVQFVLNLRSQTPSYNFQNQTVFNTYFSKLSREA